MLRRRTEGFTIVELLIVIVVIGILAAITIVAFSGVQQRANNTKRVNTVQQYVKLISAYVATYDAYPATASSCATANNACTNNSGVTQTTNNATLLTELRKVGTVPEDMGPAVGGRFGMQYNYNPSATYNGETYPIRLEYLLEGAAKSCGVPNVTTAATGGVTSTTGYTFNNTTHTTCWVMVK